LSPQVVFPPDHLLDLLESQAGVPPDHLLDLLESPGGVPPDHLLESSATLPMLCLLCCRWLLPSEDR